MNCRRYGWWMMKNMECKACEGSGTNADAKVGDRTGDGWMVVAELGGQTVWQWVVLGVL